MNVNRIYVGNIKKCTKYDNTDVFISKDECSTSIFGKPEIESEVYKENAILIKTLHYGYVDLDTCNSYLDTVKINLDLKDEYYKEGVMSTNPSKVDELFVDYNSLRPFSELKDLKKISVKELKKQKLYNKR